MATGPRYRVEFRRKQAGLTNYDKRLKLIKSGMPRLVVRKSNNATVCQVVEYADNGDRTVAAATSLSLKKLGYKAHTKNIPASYLTGYMCGLKAKKKGITEAILDTGLYRSTKGSRIYAALKGFADAGIKIAFDAKICPEERKIHGYQIEDYAKVLESKQPEKYEKVYSKILNENKFEPTKMVEHFQEIKKRISGEFA
ncbi:MAG: 50S ribosomal protein L18 [Candidatus Nanoarchaeia archaeon]|nr:50S ribosomal protein L18 [Candidatus Nanoarchaeia archaeon]MDD5239652.1 50S ribosomal protein L18 [Candidatus Nanoarchaeia archaeon]